MMHIENFPCLGKKNQLPNVGLACNTLLPLEVLLPAQKLHFDSLCCDSANSSVSFCKSLIESSDASISPRSALIYLTNFTISFGSTKNRSPRTITTRVRHTDASLWLASSFFQCPLPCFCFSSWSFLWWSISWWTSSRSVYERYSTRVRILITIHGVSIFRSVLCLRRSFSLSAARALLRWNGREALMARDRDALRLDSGRTSVLVRNDMLR